MDFIKSHILFYTNPSDKSFVMTLNGIRGVFQSDQFIALDALPNEFDAKTLLEASDKKTFFDNFDLDPASITTNQPRCNVLASHVPVKLKNDQTIFVMLIQKPLSKSDVVDWIQKKTVSRPTASKSKLPLEDPLTDHVNKYSPGVYLAIDNWLTRFFIFNVILRQTYRFIKSVRQRPPKTMDLASVQWADFLDELQGMMGDKRDDTITDRLDNIEDYMCTYLYDK
ncbi:hypothetical protein DM01DRAFT_126728 [Hesseltinella vesiculosa]|uniref:Uncharacterized protein n=1 Tax=Hesseltinella vesiculosa TaxID=101127 RepID=A0A1X2G2Q2_9FUNG|nr:hypothetical protein DM01DRAFT_126728 [Hesseltinella vesiculosa]